MITFILVVTLNLPGMGASEWHSATTFKDLKTCTMVGKLLEQKVNGQFPGVIKLVECGRVGYGV